MDFLKNLWCTITGWEYFREVLGMFLSAAVGSFLSWLFTWLKYTKNELRRRCKLRKLHKNMKQDFGSSIVAFDTVAPCYDKRNAKMRMTNNAFIFEIPEDIRTELDALGFKTYPAAKLDGTNAQLYAFLRTHYPESFPTDLSIDTYLNQLIIQTANNFIERRRANKLAFNNEQIGIDNIDLNRTSYVDGNGVERPIIELRLYKTDYFTAQVMVDLYKELRAIDIRRKVTNPNYVSPFDNPTIQDLNREFRPFMSSLGVGGYVIFDKGQGLEYWTVLRSSSIRNGTIGDYQLRSYSFDETMDLRDTNMDNNGRQEASIFRGAERATEEELGLFRGDERVEGHLTDYHFTGLILIRTSGEDGRPARFEMQLLGYKFAYFDENFTYQDMQFKKKMAQDAIFEAVEVYVNPVKKRLLATTDQYTHTPESVYYAEVLRGMENLRDISNKYEEERPI
ncbi:MAG: hypothetical protein UIB40_06135 [Paludibacteraceae bacterium]|nr:hypothetical protein [Paludibacteraceae bacterium]